MWRKPSNFYHDLGIDLKGREPSSISAEEIDAAHKRIAEAHEINKKNYRETAKNSHSDVVRNSDHAKTLSPEELEKYIASKEQEFIEASKQWEKDKSAFERAEAALKGLKDPKVRAGHDENLKYSSGRGTGWQGEASSDRGKSSGRGSGGGNGGYESPFSDFRSANKDFRKKLETFIKDERAAGRTPDLKDFSLSFKNLEGMDLEGCKTNGSLFDVNLKGAKLKGVDFSNNSISNVLFDEKTQLEGANFSNTVIHNTNFPKNLKDINFSSVNVIGSGSGLFNGKVFENCNFDGLKSAFSSCSNSTFKNCSFNDVNFNFNKISNVTFEGGKLTAKLEHANLENVTLRNVESEMLDLTRATVKGLKIEGSIKGLRLRRDQVKEIDMTAAKIADLKFFDFFGQEVKGAAVVDTAGHMKPVDPLEAFGLSAANKERSFVDRMIRTSEGKIHPGKVTAIAAGTVVLGAAAYQLSKRTLWKDRLQPETSDEKAAPSR